MIMRMAIVVAADKRGMFPNISGVFDLYAAYVTKSLIDVKLVFCVSARMNISLSSSPCHE